YAADQRQRKVDQGEEGVAHRGESDDQQEKDAADHHEGEQGDVAGGFLGALELTAVHQVVTLGEVQLAADARAHVVDHGGQIASRRRDTPSESTSIASLSHAIST